MITKTKGLTDPKGFTQNHTQPVKQLSKGMNPDTKGFYELLLRTFNTPGASVYIWRSVTPLLSTPSRLVNPYVYEIKSLNISGETLDIVDALNDGIYLKLIGYIWENGVLSNMDSGRIFNKNFLGMCIDLDVFANYVQKRIVNKGKFNIKKRVFYLVGDKRV
jgi:hypothetical protein